MKRTVQIVSLLMIVCMLLGSCAQGTVGFSETINDAASKNEIIDAGTITPSVDGGVTNKSENLATDSSADKQSGATPEKGTYNEGIVLVKYDGEFNENVLSQLDFISAEPLYTGSSWYTVTLGESMDTVEAVEYLNELDCFENVDYDYIMNTGADTSSVDVSGNPDYDKEKHHDTHNIPDGWKHIKENGKHPGGSPDVIVAVIDTGVDYNHLDLRNNIWVNPAEIANNGIDDDGNGYVDDIYGWDCVGDDSDPMDDNGHGTHVAGIIAAENNNIGGVGIAYNCKIMVLKAGNSSGYFNNSDIAEAIQYAYMNGASVINMSFGGSNISIAVEEALENAYNQCVLVAAAGNEGACNNLACRTCLFTAVSYPAALPYVIGVMSCSANGTAVSGFSNYDHYPHNSVEYEVFAVGEAIPSCWPGNKYATLNGTSMAAPTVAGIAALLRSAYPDRDTYSTKYLQSQIVNTGTVLYAEHSVANVFDALTKLPVPDINLYDYSINDSTSISANNNGNGVIDAGETVRLSVSLQNRGGVASNVSVTIDTMRNNDPSLTDPYFTFVNTTMTLSDIGTYSVRESGDEKYFEIVVSADCPNDYLVNFNIRFTYKNGLDENDNTVYEDDGNQKAQFNISRGYHLPSIIAEDTVFTNDRLYIIAQDLVIPEGVTVTFEEGTQIQVYHRGISDSPRIKVYGSLVFNGSEEKRINLFLGEGYHNCPIIFENHGVLNFVYTDAENVIGSISQARNSRFYQKCTIGDPIWYNLVKGAFVHTANSGTYLHLNIRIQEAINCYFDVFIDTFGIYVNTSTGSYYHLNTQNFTSINSSVKFNDNVVVSSLFDNSRLSETVCVLTGNVSNNVFLAKTGNNSSNVACFDFSNAISTDNYFDEQYKKYAPAVFKDFYSSAGIPSVDIYGSLADASRLWPYVVSVEMFDKDGNPITTVGREKIKVRVTFNKAMDPTQDTYMSFGTIEPYADYRIDGEWISDTVWEGSYTLKAQIENGQNFLKVNNACAADDSTKTVFGKYHLYEFTIDTTEAMSMNLQAIAKENGIELTFAQDDYDTLLGYNIYRAESKDGNYVKLNSAILLPSDETFLDENAEPGKTYWYTYTVVLTDFSESNPAGKVVATAMDTLAPNMYHTPVNQGYMNNNLVISCTASDNVAVSSVVLYYRTVGTTEWKTLSMLKQNDKYSATIFGSELTLDGIEYYIVAYDTNNSIAKGSAETPYKVVVKDASAISRIGDVDGDGTVTTKDALMIMQCINGDLIMTDDEFKRADLNGDGTLSSVEALRILQYINGNVTTLEM